MPTHPRGPRVSKGALITFVADTSVGNVITFQYNPSTLTRSLTPQYIGAEKSDQAENIRFTGAPVEDINLTVQVDAVDQLEQGKDPGSTSGIHAQLAALELLTAPTMSQANATLSKLAAGTLEILPEIAPLTVFIFGGNRIVPVKVKQVSITEEAHDAALNPIRAQVTLSMEVLTYSNQPPDSPGSRLYMRYQSHKADLAKSAIADKMLSPQTIQASDIVDASESL
jgi:hypothetical protein